MKIKLMFAPDFTHPTVMLTWPGGVTCTVSMVPMLASQSKTHLEYMLNFNGGYDVDGIPELITEILESAIDPGYVAHLYGASNEFDILITHVENGCVLLGLPATPAVLDSFRESTGISMRCAPPTLLN